jgi:hypothetical protein
MPGEENAPAELLELLRALPPPPPPRSAPEPLTVEQIERLRALGYMK